LLLHLGRNHRLVISRLRHRDKEPVPASLKDTSFVQLESPWLGWLESGKAPANEPIPLELVRWLEEGARELATALDEVDSDTPVWNFTGSAKIPANFYQRQMAIETTLHRWDAQNALPGQNPGPVEPDLAYAGLNLLFGFLPMRRKNFQGPPGNGETYHFHRTDGEGEWLLTFNGDELDIKQVHAKGDVAIRGSACDLLLFLWRRLPADRLEIFGDRALVQRYFELLPPL
jgi:uncharacterized protein (TIGR03083 family)